VHTASELLCDQIQSQRIGHAAMVGSEQDAVSRFKRSRQAVQLPTFHRLDTKAFAEVPIEIFFDHPGPEPTINGQNEFVGLFDNDVLHERVQVSGVRYQRSGIRYQATERPTTDIRPSRNRHSLPNCQDCFLSPKITQLPVFCPGQLLPTDTYETAFVSPLSALRFHEPHPQKTETTTRIG